MDKMNDLCALLDMDDIEEKSAKTKRGLLPSIIAVIVCIAMLAGTTLAWFTDTTSSGLNQIRSGNLDVAVQYTLDGKTWKELDGATDLFGGSDALFEPGYTRVVAFMIVNNGGVALKYKVGLNVVSETKGTNKTGDEFLLSDYLKVKTAPATKENDVKTAFASREDGTTLTWKAYDFNDLVIADSETINAGDEAAYYYVMKVYMPEEVGNIANAKSKDDTASIDFGVDFVATQAPVERDSYDEKYDKDATYPVADVDELTAALANEEASVIILGDNMTLDTSRLDINRDVTIDLNNHTLSSTAACANGSVFNVRSGEVTIENGTLIGVEGDAGQPAPYEKECDVITVRSGATATLKNVTISVDSKQGACVYAFDGAKVYIESGTYTNRATGTGASGEKSMLVNQADGKPQAIFISGGIFFGADPAEGDNSGSPTTFLADGYKSVSATEGGTTYYAVVPVE